MIICEITKVLPHGAFELKSGAKEFHVVLEFYGVDMPQVKDKLLIHEKLLDPHWKAYKQPYAFQFIADFCCGGCIVNYYRPTAGPGWRRDGEIKHWAR